MRIPALVAVALSLAAPAHSGDPAAGERLWRQCQACHMIVDGGGNVIQQGGRDGPNLYGIIGSRAASVAGFRYSAELSEARDMGLVWDQARFVDYVTNPTGFLRRFLDRPSARSPMGFQMRAGAADMFAYLRSVAR